MKYFAILLTAIFFTTTATGQDRYELAKENLQELKNGMLLVRLKTKAGNIEALQERGRGEEAEELKQEQNEENKETILAFSQIFDFAPVYFFYSEASDAISKGNLAGNIFDKDLNKITKTEGLPESYLIAEFDETNRLGIDGLVVMDSSFSYLESPFPHYAREHIFFGLFSRSKGQMVEHYNEKLHDRYELWFGEG